MMDVVIAQVEAEAPPSTAHPSAASTTSGINTPRTLAADRAYDSTWQRLFFCVAVTQPILDLLGRNAEFFVARSAPPVDIILLALALAVLVPVAIGLAVLGIGRIHSSTGIAIHVVVLSTLGFIIGVQLVEALTLEFPLMVILLLGLAVGIGATALAYRSSGFRFLLRVGMIAPLAILVVFGVFSSASRLIATDGAITGPTGVVVGNPVPVVMVVLDEFPVASLIDGEGNIQGENYPNFARLASDGYWFRNAITNETSTVRAIPVLLTGAPAVPGALPIASDYPSNLFTLLDGIYEIDVVEDLTDLCPDSVCKDKTQVTSRQRWQGMVDDLWIVAMHIVLPAAMTSGLPPIDQSWSDFRAQELTDSGSANGEDFDLRQRFDGEIEKGRHQQFARFLENLGSTGTQPSFDFVQLILPHSPWEYYPDGKRYRGRAPKPKADKGWGSDTWLVDQAYQRHLLQLQYVDTLIGQMIERLEADGLYDDSLVVVLADHGIVFRPNVERRRGMTDESIGEIAAIPLFIKPPHAAGPVLDDYRAEIMDVFPTIAAILEVEPDWNVQGISILSDDRPVRTESTVNSGQVVFGVDGHEKLEVARRKIASFGEGNPFGLAPSGTKDLLGTRLDDLTIEESGSVVGRIVNLSSYENVDTTSDTPPIYTAGTVDMSAPQDNPFVIAVSVNGTISAVTRSYLRDGEVLWQAYLPAEALVDGVNEVRLILVDDSGGEIILSFISAGLPYTARG